KVDGWRKVMRSQCLTYGSEDHAVNRPVIIEFDLRLRRVNVDIDMPRIDFDKQYIEREAPFPYQSLECAHHSVVEVIASDEAVVNENKLLTPRLPGGLGSSDVTMKLHQVCFFLAWRQLLL